MPLFQFDHFELFRPDSLSWVMAGLILFVVINVLAYSNRYLAGDKNQRRHRRYVLLLATSVMAIVFADHLLVLLAGWVMSNLLLVRLMIHKDHWRAARNSGLLALKTFGFGSVFLGMAFWLLAENAGTASIASIVQATDESTTMHRVALILIAIAALTQSAAWPFHRWLTSSLNSPTPVSALMHAGLVNGGGFLLVRFAPLFATQSVILHGLFLVGLITAVIGTFWKLLQTDIKRMLACSTMGQMGFMLLQCGMGLFAPAISHLCWHGLFKAYLFLSAGSVVQEKRAGIATEPSLARILMACPAGLCGAFAFTLTSGTDLSFVDTSSLMIALAFMAATQLAVGLLGESLVVSRVLGTFLVGAGAGGMYGLSIRLVETALNSLHTIQPQPMDAVYFAGIATIVVLWMAMILNLPARLQSRATWKRLYMKALNASQPHPQTVTSSRTAYQS